MITAKQLSDRVLVQSLRSTMCPVCADTKKTKQTFCWPCYRKLPADMKRATYNLLGSGYREAVLNGMNFLNAEKVFLDPTTD